MLRQGLKEYNQAPYTQECLQPGTSTSQEFFKHCTYQVNLRDLYTLEGTCYYHEGMEYCPVLLRMGPSIKQQINKFYPELDISVDYKYVLQVWSSESEKVYEKILINPLKSWSIWYNYLIFQPDAADEESNFIHMVDLKRENSLVKIDDFMQDPEFKFFAYHKRLFYIASKKEVLIFQLDDKFEQGGSIEIDPRRGPIARIISFNEQVIHGLYTFKEEENFIYLGIETIDNQIDFNRLLVKQEKKEDDEQNFKPLDPRNFQYTFKQALEIVPRPVKQNNKIREFQFVITKNPQDENKFLSTGVALRETGSVDFYNNMALVSTFEHNNSPKVNKNQPIGEAQGVQDVDYSIQARQIGLSFDETFVGFNKIINGKELARSMKNSARNQMSIEASQVLDDLNFKNIFFQKIQNHCKIFSCFVFVQTYIFVAHANILSLFDVQKLKWKEDNHLVFEDTIIKVFRSINRSGGFDICVMLKNGKVQVIVQKDVDYFIDYNLQLMISGEFIQYDQDRDDNRFTFIMSKLDDGKILLYCYYQRQLIEIQDQFRDIERLQMSQPLTENTNFVFFFAEADETRFSIQESDQITIFTIQAKELQVNKSDDDYEEGKYIVQILIKSFWSSPKLEYNQEQIKGKTNFPLFGEFHAAISIVDRKDKVKYKDLPKEALDFQAQQYFFFFDDHHIYIFYKRPIEGRPFLVFYNEEVKGLFFSDNNYLYTLSYKRPEKGTPSSFRLYDIWNCISTSSSLSYELSQVQVGCQPLIDFSYRNQRLVYQATFNNLEIVPVLHRNQIYFMGMRERDQYISTRVIDDKFIALDRNNQLTSWSTLNGKVVSDPFAFKNADYSGFQIFRYKLGHEVFDREWFTQTLLISEEPLEADTVNESLFFQPEELKAMKNQVPFAKRFDKAYHQFKLVQIMNERDVKEVASFTYPYWKGQMQYLYFSEDANFMYERLFFERAQIYERVNVQDSSQCSWKLVKRLTNLPEEFTTGTQYPFYLSPDFKKYLDIDQQQETFVIREVLSQKTLLTIPKWMMSFTEDGLRSAVNRFKWRSNTEIQVINKEGIERIFPIFEANPEYSSLFHAIPLYQSLWCSKNHYYFDKPLADQNNILERLKRKYQVYKQLRLMEKKNVALEVYPQLFTVDYSNRKEGNPLTFDRHVIDHSFTFLHWNLIEQLVSGKLQLDQINDEQLKCLIYNIFPSGQTVLHMVARSQSGDLLEKLLQKCHIQNEQLKKLTVRLHLPFVQNFEGVTPMDILKAKADIRGMDKMLYNLTPYGVDHHSREIKHLFPFFINSLLPNLNAYLQSRVIQTSYLKTIDKSGINQDGLDVPGISPASFWLSNDADPQRNLLLIKGEREVRVEFIDIADLHCYNNQDSQNFFQALADCQDPSVFQQFAVQKIIDFKWALTEKYTIRRLFYPYLIFMATYLLYMNWFYLVRNEPGYEVVNYGFIGALGFFCQYFFILEMKQLRNEGISYLSSVWNYLDLIPPIALSVFLPMELFGFFNYQSDVDMYIARQRMADLIGDGSNPMTVEDPTVTIRSIEGVLQSIMSLIIWLKLLYFLRINKNFGQYIRLIVEVVVDMKYFLALLLLTFIAFGDSMRQISSSNPSGEDFIGGTIFTAIAYVYRMVLGDFDTNAFGSTAVGYVWILFFLCTLFNMIIMLNLLIAIISESFAKVDAFSQQASFQEQSDIIAENTYLIPTDVQETYCSTFKYLVCATDLQSESDAPLGFEDKVSLVQKQLGALQDDTGRKLAAKLEAAHQFELSVLNIKAKQVQEDRGEVWEVMDAINEKFYGRTRKDDGAKRK